MKNRDIYVKALHLLAQSTDENENLDYLAQAPHFLSAFCCEAFETDKILRASSGDTKSRPKLSATLSLDDNFPLLDRLVPAASFYLASMIVLNEDADISDKMYKLYCDAMASAISEIPAKSESISNKYFSV